jgi:hypothetical protein
VLYALAQVVGEGARQDRAGALRGLMEMNREDGGRAMSEVTPAYPPMTAARAAALADFHERAITFEHGEVARRHGPYVTAYTDMLFTLDTTGMPPRPAGLSKRLHAFIRSSCIDAALVRRWRRHRVVYTLDLDLGRELMTSDPDDVIPGGLVRQLPHPDPYLALPEPVLIPIEKQPGLFTQIKGLPLRPQP